MSIGHGKGIHSRNVRMTSEFRSLKGLSKRITFRGLSLKHQRGEGSSSGRFTSAKDDIIDEGCRSSLGRGLRPHPPLQEADKVEKGVPMEEGSSLVHGFDIKALCNGIDFYAVSSLSLHVLGLGDAQVPDCYKLLHG